MKYLKDKLPIDEALTELCQKVLETRTFVLKASPGSGKTTRLPAELLKHFSQSVLVLEPRRLAARFAASRVASETETALGKEVGYAFRYERCVQDQTRLIFYTEGTFLRLLLNNPELKGVDVVVLDEFHERHKETDVAWALLQKLQETKRPDLRLVVMSATLDKDSFPKDSSFFELEAPLYPLELHYLDHTPSALGASLEKKVYEALWKALDYEGDVLIFLPGMRDILRVKEALIPLCGENSLDLFVLHGDLSNEEQAQVMQRGKRRKVILSTNIAESSLTIPGVQIVIDSGLFRESSFSPWSGLSHLETKKISKASAIQRAGRAARTGPGHVFRLYSKHEFAERSDFEKPEILRTDLCETLLLLATLGVEEALALPWVDQPPLKALESASLLLNQLGALSQHRLTELGKKMSRFPLHPRLARLMLEASFYSNSKKQEMIEFISSLEEEGFLRKRLAQQLSSLMKGEVSKELRTDTPLENLLLKGFVDRLGTIRQGKHLEVLLCNGETLGVSRELASSLNTQHPLLLVLDVSSSKEMTRFAAIEEEWLYELEPFPIEEKRLLSWEEERQGLFYYEELRVGQILLSQSRRVYRGEALDENLNLLLKKITTQVLHDFVIKLQKEQGYLRLKHFEKLCLNKLEDFPLSSWIEERASHTFSLSKEAQEGLVQDYLSSLQIFLDPDSKLSLEDLFPEKLLLRDRRSLEIHYEDDPWVEGFIQDFYGMSATPTIGKGRVPLVLRLLGPHKRPLQITKDLVSFWNKTYKELYNELSRDYPRHHWPLKPETAPPLLLKRHLPTS